MHLINSKQQQKRIVSYVNRTMFTNLYIDIGKYDTSEQVSFVIEL